MMLLEPANVVLLRGVIILPTLVSPQSPLFQVHVVNLSQEYVWLQPRTKLGLLSPVKGVENQKRCEVNFEHVSARVEQITVTRKTHQLSDSNLKQLLDKIDVGGTPEQRAELWLLLTSYAEVFAFDDDDLGYTDKVQHKIQLVDDIPVTQPYRRIPPTQYGEVREHITQLLTKGIIQASSSSMSSGQRT